MSFEFTVEDWELLRDKDSLDSPVFSKQPCGERTNGDLSQTQAWMLEVMPHGLPDQPGLAVALKNCCTSSISFAAALSVFSYNDNSSTCRPFINCHLTPRRTILPDKEEIMVLKDDIDLTTNCTRAVFKIDIITFGSPEVFTSNNFMDSFGEQRTIARDLTSFFESCNPEIAGNEGEKSRHPLSDIVLTSGSTEIYCHMAILAARSPVFAKKFTRQFIGTRLFFSNGRYPMDGTAPDTLKVLVEFIYSDHVSEQNLLLHGQSLLVAACKYRIHALILICEQFLADTIMPDTAASLLILAEKNGCSNLLKAAGDFIASHIQEVTEHDSSYYTLSGEQMRIIMSNEQAEMQRRGRIDAIAVDSKCEA